MTVTSNAAVDELAGQSRGVLVTGANGHLGRRLLRRLSASPSLALRALVRSATAAARLSGLEGDAVTVGDYRDPAVLSKALGDCDSVVHFVGIIKESRGNSFHDAHVATTRSLLEVAERQGVRRIVYLSIVGSAPEAQNDCLRSKGEAEALLRASSIPATILRVPMVLGEGDYASAALRKRALAGRTLVFRAASLEQPIYAGDVIDAVLQALCRRDEATQSLDLPGPELLSRASLIQRAALVLGQQVEVRSLPIGFGYTAAWVLERLLANPPFTRAMLGVLDHDDEASNAEALRELGLELTELDETLRRCLELAG